MKTYGNDRAKTFGISSSLIDAVRKVTSGQPIEEETPAEESKPQQLDESMSIHVTPHNNGTHHVVKKVGSKMKKHGGVKVGEKLSDTEVDDAKDSGIKVHHEAIQCDLPGRKKKLKDTPVEKAKKMHLAATPGQENAVTEDNVDEDYGAHQDAKAHMKKVGASSADQQKYSDHHMAKRGYTHHDGGMYKKGTPHEGPFSSPVRKIKVDPNLSRTESVNPLIAAASAFIDESGMGRVAYQKQSGEPGTGLETFKKKPKYKTVPVDKAALPKDQALTKNLDAWRLKGKVKLKGVSRDKRLGKEEVEFDEEHKYAPEKVENKVVDHSGDGEAMSVRSHGNHHVFTGSSGSRHDYHVHDSKSGKTHSVNLPNQKMSHDEVKHHFPSHPDSVTKTIHQHHKDEVDWRAKKKVDEANLPRQMKDPKKDAMVSHPKHGTKVIDKKDEDKHLKKGWVRAEAFDPDLLDEGFQSAIDSAMRSLDSITFKRRYGHSKAEMRKRLQGISAVSGAKVRREDVSHPEFGKGMYIEDGNDRVTAMFGDGIKEIDLDEIDDWYIDGESVAVPLSEKKKKKLDRVDTKGLEGEWGDRDDKDIDNDGDEDESDRYLHKRRKKIKKSMKEWTQDTIVGKMIENPSRSAADAYQLATHFYNMSKGIDEELLDKAATFYETFLEMDQGENPVFRFEHMDKVLEARKGGGAAVGETERSGHRVTKTEKDGPEHIAMQLRKVGSLKGQHSGVDFNNGSKEKIKPHHAAAALNRYNAAKPAEKEEMQRHMAHSHDALKHVASGKPLHSSPAAQKKSSSIGFKSSARLEPTRDLVHPAQDKRPK